MACVSAACAGREERSTGSLSDGEEEHTQGKPTGDSLNMYENLRRPSFGSAAVRGNAARASRRRGAATRGHTQMPRVLRMRKGSANSPTPSGR